MKFKTACLDHQAGERPSSIFPKNRTEWREYKPTPYRSQSRRFNHSTTLPRKLSKAGMLNSRPAKSFGELFYYLLLSTKYKLIQNKVLSMKTTPDGMMTFFSLFL